MKLAWPARSRRRLLCNAREQRARARAVLRMASDGAPRAGDEAAARARARGRPRQPAIHLDRTCRSACARRECQLEHLVAAMRGDVVDLSRVGTYKIFYFSNT